MKIRKLNSKDINAILKLHAEAFPMSSKWTEKDLKELLSLKTTYGWGSVVENELKAILLLQVSLEEAEILTFIVDKFFLRQGIGQSLYNTVEQELKRREIQSIFLEVAEDNEAAFQFYLKNKYQKIRMRSNYFPRREGIFINAISMNKRI